MTILVRVVNCANWDESVIVMSGSNVQTLKRGEVSQPFGVAHGIETKFSVSPGERRDTRHPETNSPYLGEVAVHAVPCETEPSGLPPIGESLKHDALDALRRRLHERRQVGIEDGTKPIEYSDHAQTVGWARDLMERWPKDALRKQAAELLAYFGYHQYMDEDVTHFDSRSPADA